MPRIATNDIGTWIHGEDARLRGYTLAQTHCSPVITLSHDHSHTKALILSPHGAELLALDLLRFAHTQHLSREPSGPDSGNPNDYVI